MYVIYLIILHNILGVMIDNKRFVLYWRIPNSANFLALSLEDRYEILYSKTRKRWRFNTVDCLIEVHTPYTNFSVLCSTCMEIHFFVGAVLFLLIQVWLYREGLLVTWPDRFCNKGATVSLEVVFHYINFFIHQHWCSGRTQDSGCVWCHWAVGKFGSQSVIRRPVPVQSKMCDAAIFQWHTICIL
jgi:hypothetical protein